jgi:hypothetical protein
MARARKRSNTERTQEIAAGTQSTESPVVPQVKNDTAAPPERDRIARRAYELYLARGGSDGDPMEDWLTAEREFNAGGGNRDRE